MSIRGVVSADRWAVDLIHCGRDAGVQVCATWLAADEFRHSYVVAAFAELGRGCERVAIVRPATPGTRLGYHDPAPYLPSSRRIEAGPVEAGSGAPAVTHLALIQASLPPGLTEVAGGAEQHCRAQLERWVAERGLRDGERALIVAVVAETVAEPGVGVYTVPADRP